MSNITQNNTITLHDPLSNENMKKQFGIFVGLYNRTNDTSLSVKQAAMIEDLVKTFNMSIHLLSRAHTVVSKDSNFKSKTSTKMKSYSLLDIPKVDGEVLEYIQNNPGESRMDIANGMGIRMSTVCGAIYRLSHNSFVYISGVKIDSETKRKVEVITAR